ncbi:MAG: DUF488 family protein [Candidatus Omnitrophica bacterium]|nr:DUF488 family protein [Candidatus Omnitrophota bacterium]
MGNVLIKRVYVSPLKSDGYRILVDRLWPRGISKQAAKIDHWLKDIAPSNELRKWFNHEPQKWEKFKKRYHQELLDIPDCVDWLKHKAKTLDKVTLVFSASDETYNNAAALKALLKL